MNKIERDPRVSEGPGFMVSLKDWMRRAALSVNGLVEGLLYHEKMTVDASGNVSVPGQVTAGGQVVAPATAGFRASSYFADSTNFAVQGLTANPAWETLSVQGYHVPGVWAGWRMVVGTTSPAVFEFRNNATGYSLGGWVATSDRRRKTDLVPVDGALDRVDALTAYTYLRPDIVDRFAAEPRRYLGLIAQDVLEVAPEAVTVDATEEALMSLDYGSIAALGIQAIKELRAVVREQAERLAKLEGN